jgi:acyl carrier protein
MPDVKEQVRSYILREFLPGTDAAELTDRTPLITGAILDSIATLQLVSFLEEQFGIVVAAHEASVDHLNTLDQVEALVHSKRR